MNYSTIYFPSLTLKKLIGLIAVVLLAVPPLDLSATEVYQALLRGRHEVLPVTTPASGTVTATLKGNYLFVEGSFSGLMGDFASNVAGGSHIHMAFAGQNGGIELTLTPELDEDLRGGTFLSENNVFILSDDQVEALAARKMYVNIHSTFSPSGELRGQLLLRGNDYYYTNLSGSNEVPAVMSEGSGALALELDGNTLTVSGSFQNLEGTLATQVAGGAHLHLGFAGENGGIEVLLNPTPSEDGKSAVFLAEENTIELESIQVKAIEARKFYANIHSSAFLSGELRGQVLGMARTVFRAHLSGSNENPAVTTMATGVILAELMADGRLINSGSFDGLESMLALGIGGGSHIHNGIAGRNGPVLFRLFVRPRGNLRSGTLQASRNINRLSEDQVEALYDRRFYANIHTLNYNSGEIRGQLLPESQMVFNGFLSSIFQTGGQMSTGSGGVKAELTGNQLTLSGSFQGLSSALAVEIGGGAHIHRAMAGSNGAVTQALSVTPGDEATEGFFEAGNNVFELTEEDIADLKARRKYVNIHTENNLPGEIRSQLLPEATTYFVAPLSGTSMRNPLNNPSLGMTILEVTGKVGISSGSFNNLGGSLSVGIAGGAHVHGEFAGLNGRYIFKLNSSLSADQLSGTFPASENVQSFKEGFIERLRNRGTYVDVHSGAKPGGEIRGQLLPLATAYFTATLSGMNSVPPVNSKGKGQVKVELHGSQMVLSGGFFRLKGDFATNIAGGSHLHQAAAGSNGPILLSTSADLDEDLKGGRFLPEDNTFDLESDDISELVAGNLYLNIHTTASPPGEIRGQVLGEINAFPSAEAAIVAPESGSAITIAGDPATPFTASWAAASDRDDLVYTWQLSAGDTFFPIRLLVNQNVGSDLSFTTDLATIDGLLASAGLEIGESITLLHRAVASDGSVATPGPAASITLTRGEVGSENGFVDLSPNSRQPVSTFMVYPTLVQSKQSINVRIQAGADQQGVLVLVNQLGQPLQRQAVDLFAGDNRMEWGLPELAVGYYFVQLQTEGELLPLQRIVVN